MRFPTDDRPRKGWYPVRVLPRDAGYTETHAPDGQPVGPGMCTCAVHCANACEPACCPSWRWCHCRCHAPRADRVIAIVKDSLLR